MPTDSNFLKHDWVKQLTHALKNPLPGKLAHYEMLPANFKPKNTFSNNTRESAVLILLQQKVDEKWYLTMIQRAEYEGHHSGQMAFPGGKKDNIDKDLKTTCQREAFEEIGIPKTHYQIIGALSTVYVHVSDINIYPFLAVTNVNLKYYINEEVANVFELNLNDFFNSKNIKETSIIFKDFEVQVPSYNIGQKIIWGASAQIISELLEIIKKLK